MTARTARPARKSAQSATAPAATPAPVQAAPVATDAPVTADQAAPVVPAAYTIPTGWEADQAAYVTAVGTAYRDADKTTKAAIRTAWRTFQSDALNALDMDKLSLVRDVNAVMVTARPTVEVDPADAYVVHISALIAATEAAHAAFQEAHDAEAYTALVARLGSLTDDEVTSRDALATKLATVRTGSRRTGPQRSVEAHIRSALDAAPDGTILTCAQVHNHRSDAYGPDESPSVGAVGAAHGREMDGIASVTNDAKVKGFRAQA